MQQVLSPGAPVLIPGWFHGQFQIFLTPKIMWKCRYLHSKMINKTLPPTGPLQEVVDLSLGAGFGQILALEAFHGPGSASSTVRAGCSLCAFPGALGNPRSFIHRGLCIQCHRRILHGAEVPSDFQEWCRSAVSTQSAQLESRALILPTVATHRVRSGSSTTTGHLTTAHRYCCLWSIFKIMKEGLDVFPARGSPAADKITLCCYLRACLWHECELPACHLLSLTASEIKSEKPMRQWHMLDTTRNRRLAKRLRLLEKGKKIKFQNYIVKKEA